MYSPHGNFPKIFEALQTLEQLLKPSGLMVEKLSAQPIDDDETEALDIENGTRIVLTVVVPHSSGRSEKS
jgi:hypothetical protein